MQINLSRVFRFIPSLLVLALFCHTESGWAEADSTIKIGVVLSLTGIAASFGTRTLHGIQVAQDEINVAGNLHIEVITE